LLRYQTDREEFLKHYHKRSNAETVVSMLKTNFGDNVRCRTDTSMANEVYYKIISHNIWCLIRSIHELNILLEFFPEPEEGEAAA
jgi:transposase